MIILDEHACFQRIIDGLKQAADGARMMAVHREDTGFMWKKLAETYDICAEGAYKLSEERAIKQANTVLHKQ